MKAELYRVLTVTPETNTSFIPKQTHFLLRSWLTLIEVVGVSVELCGRSVNF